MRLATLCLVLLLGVTGCSASSRAPAEAKAPRADEQPLLGITWGGRISWSMRGGRLVRLDPRTLRPRASPQLRLGPHGYSHAFSPRGRFLALGGFRARVRVVRVDHLRPVADVRAGRAGLVLALAWPSERRVLALVGPPLGHPGLARVVSLDPVGRHVMRSQEIPCRCDVLDVRSGPRGGLVLLLGPTGRIGRARLAVVGPTGRVRLLPVAGVEAGHAPAGRGVLERMASPALTLDPARGRAVLVAGESRAVEVNLETGEALLHALEARRSLLDRVAGWLQPPAWAKGAVGPRREAVWLRDGVVAVSGFDLSSDWDTTPAGLNLIDTRRWTVETVDERPHRVLAAAGIAVAFGGDTDGTSRGPGVAAFTHRGELLWRRFDGRMIHDVQVAGDRLYVQLRRRAVALDLATGRTLSSLRLQAPRILEDAMSEAVAE